MTTYVFAGQGSQKRGMGGSLFEEFEEVTAKADAILGYSIQELCLKDPRRELLRTQFTQPAMYVVNALSYLKRCRQRTGKPDYLAGHSLGEYNALLAAGVFDFETGLRLVKRRGELIAECGGGAMAAVIGLSKQQVEDLLRQHGADTLDIANDNAPDQVVIAGPRDVILRVHPLFEAAGATRFVPLNVSGAFHSRYMQQARDGFAKFLSSVELSPPQIPVVSNVHARCYEGAEIKQSLVEQIASPVRWTESIQCLLRLGEVHFEEVGQGAVLIELIRKIQAQSPSLARQEPPRAATAEPVAPSAVPAEAADDAGRERAAAQVEPASRPMVAAPACSAASLGARSFRADYGVRYAYAASSTSLGAPSVALAVKMAKAGLLGYFGAVELDPARVEGALDEIRRALPDGETFGMGLVHHPARCEIEQGLVDVYLKHGVRCVEACGHLEPTPPLVEYRLRGLGRAVDGGITIAHKVLVRVSRPEVAEQMAAPAPESVVQDLLRLGRITETQATLARSVPVADDLCVESDAGGIGARRSALALLPVVRRVRDELSSRLDRARHIRVGLTGGIGTPEAAAAAFALGAEFIVTGSINQCTVEGALSDVAKDLLEQADVHDTDYVASPDLESGTFAQVLKKGVLFPSRASKLLELYRAHDSIEAVDPRMRAQIQDRFFRRSFDAVYDEIRAARPEAFGKAERDPKYKMGLIFSWYLRRACELSLEGDKLRAADYQIHCGPSLGAFNRWVRGTPHASWRARHVDEVARMIMEGAAEHLARATTPPDEQHAATTDAA